MLHSEAVGQADLSQVLLHLQTVMAFAGGGVAIQCAADHSQSESKTHS
jgi:hypothetical protein